MKKTHHGFTTIELTAVLLITGIIGMVALSGTFTDVNERTEKDKIKDHLRYAQFKSLSNDVYYWRITFVSSGDPNVDNSYTLSKINSDDGIETQVNFPGEDLPTQGLGIKILNLPITVMFNKWGEPVNNSSPYTARSVDQEIRIDDGTPSGSLFITIKKNTGFVE